MANGDTAEYFTNYKFNKCKKADACYYRKVYKEGILYFVKDYYLDSSSLQMSGAFSDDSFKVQEGFFYWYHPNKHLQSKGRFVHGKKMGLWKSYSEDDRLIDSTYYLNDIPYISASQWDLASNLVFTGNYDKEGKGSGVEIGYYPDGKIASHGKRSAGYMRDSIWTFYHPNSKIASQVTFSNNVAVKKECFDENGNPQKECDSSNLKQLKDGWIKHVMSTLRYPEDARENGNQGLVEIQFEIDFNGNVQSVRPYISSQRINYSCIKEAERVIHSLPNRGPVKIYNRPVRYFANQPITFRLE